MNRTSRTLILLSDPFCLGGCSANFLDPSPYASRIFSHSVYFRLFYCYLLISCLLSIGLFYNGAWKNHMKSKMALHRNGFRFSQKGTHLILSFHICKVLHFHSYSTFSHIEDIFSLAFAEQLPSSGRVWECKGHDTFTPFPLSWRVLICKNKTSKPTLTLPPNCYPSSDL